MNASSLPAASAAIATAWRQWWEFGSPGERRGPLWARLVVTGLFSAALAVVFTVLGFVTSARTAADWLSPLTWATWYGHNLLVSLTIGYVIQGLFALARRTIGHARIRRLVGWQRTLFFGAIPVLGVMIGWPIGVSLIYGNLSLLKRMTVPDLFAMAAMSALISGLILLYFSLRYRQAQAEARASEARLQLLQGQMEPHFLFNTLANVISLIDADAPRARRVLEAFTDYLRASLGSMRASDSTLGAEIELAERFLSLMQARMGERLRFEIVAEPALRDAVVPPLLLQPLVENAVKHGLEPQVDGGTVHVRIERVAGALPQLRLCVEDDGAGLDAPVRGPRPRGAGIALANLRERLHALYGNAAVFTLAAGAGGRGTLACLVLPHRTTRLQPSTPKS
jgi:two-component sensor histidine kinase